MKNILPEVCQKCIAQGGGHGCPQGCSGSRICRPSSNGTMACSIQGCQCVICMLAAIPMDSFGRDIRTLKAG